MIGWTIALVSGALLLPVVGFVYGAHREPMDRRDGAVIIALAGSVSMFWVAASVLTLHVLF